MSREVLKLIQNRRSVRRYLDKDIPMNEIETIMEAGRWAPSGLNNQPWRFSVIKNPKIKEKLSGLTKYKRIVKECNTCIAVFYHHPSGYHRDKDMMAIGACVQNMLLAATSLEIGTVWLGEILNKKDEVNILLELDKDFELCAVIALGYPDESPQSTRDSLVDLRLSNFI